jgi:hypothetical protein
MIFLISCNSVDNSKQKNQSRDQLKLRKHIPEQNRTLINRVNNNDIHTTLSRIKSLEEQEIINLSSRSKPSKLNYSKFNQSDLANNSQYKSQQIAKNTSPKTYKSQPKKPKIEEDLILKKSPIEEEDQLEGNEVIDNKIEKPKPQDEILEISGDQNKNKYKAKDEALFFILSTSASYNENEVDEIKKILSQYGNVKIEKQGENFSVKLYSKNPIRSKADADKFLKQVIKHPFFDIFIEELY